MPYPPNTSDVRGCQFFNSVYRELYFTETIGKLLEQNQLVSGNAPLGLWKYDFEHASLKNEYRQSIDKYCGLLFTLGDRRLTTHLFQGAEALLIQAASQAGQIFTESDVEALVDVFRAKGRFDETKQEVRPTWKCKIFRQPKVPVFHHTEGKFSKDPGGLHSDFIRDNLTYTKEENEVLVDLVNASPSLEKLESALKALDINQLRAAITKDGPLIVDDGVTDSVLMSFKDVQSTGSVLQALALIFARCGAECGKVKRLLDEAEISWGYFTDHNPYEPHCNAHPNNFLVIDPIQNKNHCLTAALDFDLAFDFVSFTNTIEPDPEVFTDEENMMIQKERFCSNDREQFDDWLNNEKYELE